MATEDVGLFSPSLVFLGMEARDRHELFGRLGHELEARGLIRPSWYDAIEEREDAYPTGLHFEHIDVAIPHVDPTHITRPYIAIVRPAEPVVFEHMAHVAADVPAQLVVNLGVVRDGGQVAVLQTLMGIFADEAKATALLGQDTPEGMVATIASYFTDSED